MLINESDIQIKDIKKEYFDMCEIIIDDNQEQDHQDHKSETTKFFERDY